MIFSLVRWFFAIVIFGVCYIFIKKSNIVNKRKWVTVSAVLAVLLSFLSTFGPIENAFITFPTIESAYNYYYSKDSYIKYIIEGKESDLVIGQKNNDTSNILTIIPKTNDGWKIGTGRDTKRVASNNSGSTTIYVYQYNSSDDYYILVHSLRGDELDVKDNRNSHFDYFEGKKGVNQTYCTYIHCFDENYEITVDGQPISFNNIKE